MKNESKIVEWLSEMLRKFDVLTAISAENSRALLKMGDYNDRIIRLERAFFKS